MTRVLWFLVVAPGTEVRLERPKRKKKNQVSRFLQVVSREPILRLLRHVNRKIKAPEGRWVLEGDLGR